MVGNGAIETFEVERKYAVTSKAEFPRSPAFAAVGLRPIEPESFTLEATYFDTSEASLGQQRIAVRKRVGGKDEGWHMKLKGADGSRELVWPLADEMPDGLLREIVDRIGEQGVHRLIAVATMRTVRTIVRVQGFTSPTATSAGSALAVHGASDADDLPDESGQANDWLVELADDRVVATNALSGEETSWREWEAELAPGAAIELFELVEPLLIGAGAERVRGTSKLQRAMGRPSTNAL
ncbi:CYTH domain-containing protein [Leucobacter sp. W1478]|uniref:CYTH domain-containing protein n=1 Tax=Leucobacter sp. W1478 TaxID=3439065 RepID=UPI003F34DAF2